MSEPFLAEIKMFGGNFPPRGYALCNGDLLAIRQNTALFSLLGLNFGGNGTVTFGLPNLQNSTPMFWGQGPGLTPRDIGETGGESTVTLLGNELPLHGHTAQGSSATAADTSPANESLAVLGRGRTSVYTNGATTVQLGLPTTPSGGNQPHNNRQPYLGITFIIALQGVFPIRP